MKGEPLLILIDTSIWIELLRHSIHPLRTVVDRLIAEDRARICAAIGAELIQGATTSKDLAAAEDLAAAVPSLESTDKNWLSAGRLAQRLRHKGLTIGLLDCYLADVALFYHASILSLDKHFPLIAKHTALSLFPLPEFK